MFHPGYIKEHSNVKSAEREATSLAEAHNNEINVFTGRKGNAFVVWEEKSGPDYTISRIGVDVEGDVYVMLKNRRFYFKEFEHVHTRYYGPNDIGISPEDVGVFKNWSNKGIRATTNIIHAPSRTVYQMIGPSQNSYVPIRPILPYYMYAPSFLTR